MTRERVEGLHQHVGFAWYTPVQWARLRELAADPEVIDQSFEAWLANAERVEVELTRRGVTIDRVPVDVEIVADWCAGRTGRSTARRGPSTSRSISGSGRPAARVKRSHRRDRRSPGRASRPLCATSFRGTIA